MQNVYPWDPTSRVLCTVLNDPDLWGAVFSAELIGVNAHHMRQGFKRIAKRVLPNHPRVVYVKNDHSIGEVLTQLLERPQGRSELDRYLGEHTRNGATCSKWFGRHLYDYLEDRWFRHIPKLSLVKESGSGSYPRLDPVRFAAWLDEHDDSELNRGAGNEVARVLCLFACSFAMRQPETALDIRDTLSRRGDPYVRLLTDSVPDAPQEPAAEAAGDPLASGLDRVHPADEPTGRSVENEGMVASPLKPARQESIVPPSPNNTLGPTATVSNVANALTLLAGTAREVLLAGARDLALDQVTTLSRGLCEFLHDLDNERVRTAAQCDQISGGFAEVARQPWLHATPPELGAGWQAGANSIRELTERAAVVELQLARLQQACTQLDALVQRLGEQPGLAVPPGTTDRDQIAEQLEHRATEYRATLRRIGDREQDVADMVERLTMVDLKHGDPLIEVTPRASWLNLLLFLLGQRAYTEPGQRIERLLGRRDLAGLVLALSWHETSEKGLDLVGALIRELRDPSDRAQWSELLSYLGIDQVVRVAEAHPALLPAVAEMLLSVAVRSDPSVLSYFERLLQLPAMDTVCARVYAAVVESWWRGELNEPLEAIRARLVPEATDLRTDLRARLLQLV
ncbi:MAG: hypothetical protein ABSE84_19525, partial [Isosphaeraceae bacterium]